MTMTNASRVGTGAMALSVRTENVRATEKLLRRLDVEWAGDVGAAVRSQRHTACELAIERVRSISFFESPVMELAFRESGSSRPMKWLVPHDPFFAALYEVKDLHALLRDEWLAEAKRTWESQQSVSGDRFHSQREKARFALVGADPEGDDAELEAIVQKRDELTDRLALAAHEERSEIEDAIGALDSLARAIASRAT